MKGTMRSMVAGLAICGVSLAFAPQASAVNLTTDPNTTDGIFLGSVTPGGGSPATETTYVNTINNLVPDDAWTGTNFDFTTGSGSSLQQYDAATTACPACTDVTSTGSVGSNDSTSIVLASGFQYIVAKYDAGNAGTLIWYVGGLGAGTYTVPQFFLPGSDQYAVSHITALGPTTGGGTGPGGGTPEPASLALFGLGLLGAGYRFRRRTV